MNAREKLKQVKNIENLSKTQIAIKIGVSKQRIHQILNGYRTIKSNKLKIVKEVYNKYNNKCFVCNIKNKLEIHHLDGNCKNNNIENLILLCRKHHGQYDSSLRKKLGKSKITIYKKICPFCKNIYYSKYRVKKYCSKKCATDSIRKTPEEKRLKYNETRRRYFHKRYNSDPEFKKMVLERNSKWQKENRKPVNKVYQ